MREMYPDFRICDGWDGWVRRCARWFRCEKITFSGAEYEKSRGVVTPHGKIMERSDRGFRRVDRCWPDPTAFRSTRSPGSGRSGAVPRVVARLRVPARTSPGSGSAQVGRWFVLGRRGPGSGTNRPWGVGFRNVPSSVPRRARVGSRTPSQARVRPKAAARWSFSVTVPPVRPPPGNGHPLTGTGYQADIDEHPGTGRGAPLAAEGTRRPVDQGEPSASTCASACDA